MRRFWSILSFILMLTIMFDAAAFAKGGGFGGGGSFSSGGSRSFGGGGGFSRPSSSFGGSSGFSRPSAPTPSPFANRAVASPLRPGFSSNGVRSTPITTPVPGSRMAVGIPTARTSNYYGGSRPIIVNNRSYYGGYGYGGGFWRGGYYGYNPFYSNFWMDMWMWHMIFGHPAYVQPMGGGYAMAGGTTVVQQPGFGFNDLIFLIFLGLFIWFIIWAILRYHRSKAARIRRWEMS